MKTLFLAALLGASALSGAAVAQDGPPPGGMRGGGMGMRAMLPEPDANGEITKEAMLANVDKRFAAMDTNHDGKVSPDERRAAMEAMGGRGGGGPRPDGAQGGPPGAGGGDETLADARERAMRTFDRLDANHDGKIDKAEMDAMRERMMAMRARANGGNPPADAPPPPGGN